MEELAKRLQANPSKRTQVAARLSPAQYDVMMYLAEKRGQGMAKIHARSYRRGRQPAWEVALLAKQG